jgi:hypothetical protein
VRSVSVLVHFAIHASRARRADAMPLSPLAVHAHGPSCTHLLLLGLVSLEEVRDLGDERVVRVGVREERADGEEDLRDREGGGPLVLEDVEADAAVRVDVRVLDLRLELDLRDERGTGVEKWENRSDTVSTRHRRWAFAGTLTNSQFIHKTPRSGAPSAA